MIGPGLVKSSVASVIRELVDADLSIQDAIQRGYGNVSSIARLLQPLAEAKLGRKLNFQSIITSVKRTRGPYLTPVPAIQPVVARSVVSVRTDVAKLSVEKSKRALATVRNMLANYQEEFLQVSESFSAVTLIFDEKLIAKVKSFFRKEDLLEEEVNLAAIIVQSPKEIIKTPGAAIAFYNQVSRRRINIEDTVSCYTDTIIVVKMEDVGKAFGALTDLVFAARREGAPRLRVASVGH